MKITKDEKRVLNYLFSSCMLGGGQRIWFIVECCFDYEYETKKVSQIMQKLKRKGLVSNYQTLWYLTEDGKKQAEFKLGGK